MNQQQFCHPAHDDEQQQQAAADAVTAVLQHIEQQQQQRQQHSVRIRLFLTRNIFDKYLGCLGPKYLSKVFLENITWERWEASYGSEIFFSGFDGGM